MKVWIDKSFEKDLKALTNLKVRNRLADLIELVQDAATPENIPRLAKIQGFDTFYRIRLGDYRVGIEMTNDEIIFLRVLHRKEVYRYFP